jgi:hypothetical protein
MAELITGDGEDSQMREFAAQAGGRAGSVEKNMPRM